jgi:hypothetical protein
VKGTATRDFFYLWFHRRNQNSLVIHTLKLIRFWAQNSTIYYVEFEAKPTPWPPVGKTFCILESESPVNIFREIVCTIHKINNLLIMFSLKNAASSQWKFIDLASGHIKEVNVLPRGSLRAPPPPPCGDQTGGGWGGRE